MINPGLSHTVSISETNKPLKKVLWIATENTETPLGVFLYQSNKPDAYNRVWRTFHAVCTPEDLVLYPINEPATDDVYRYCRYNKLILQSDASEFILSAKDKSDGYVDRLYSYLTKLTKFTYHETCPIRSTSYSFDVELYEAYAGASKYDGHNCRLYCYIDNDTYLTSNVFIVDDDGNFIEVVSPSQASGDTSSFSSYIDVILPSGYILDKVKDTLFSHLTNLVKLTDIENNLVGN